MSTEEYIPGEGLVSKEDLEAASEFMDRFNAVGGTDEAWKKYQEHCADALSQVPAAQYATEYWVVIETKPPGEPGEVREMVVGEWLSEEQADVDLGYWKKINPRLDYRVVKKEGARRHGGRFLR